MISKQKYIAAYSKSRLTSFILTLLLGPLGVFYSSVGAGIALLIVAVIGAPTIVIPVVVWIISICLGDHLCCKRNDQASAQYDISVNNFNREDK